MNRDKKLTFEERLKGQRKKKKIETTGKEGTVITLLNFILKRFCRDKRTVWFLMSIDSRSGSLKLNQQSSRSDV